MTCTDCGTPMQPRTKGAKAGHVKTTPCTNPDAALAGTCTCTCCENARNDRESEMNAGPSYISRNGIRRWVA